MSLFGFNKLVIASGNPGKLAEFDALLAPLGIEVINQTALGIADPDETGVTFVENALIKARNAAKLSGMAALADDSGLCVDVLNGAPGLISAHYAGEHGNVSANIAKLLGAMHGATNRSARFVSAAQGRALALLALPRALERHPRCPAASLIRSRFPSRVGLANPSA